MAKSWKEKFDDCKEPIVKKLELNDKKPIAGMSNGQLMLISSCMEIDKFIKNLKNGEFITIVEMRKKLASSHNADVTCPLTTGIFLRIVCEVSFEYLLENQDIDSITPFWRVVKPSDNLAKKLSCGIQFIKQMRDKELKE